MKNRSYGHGINSPRSRYIVNKSRMFQCDDAYMYYAKPKQKFKHS